MLDSHVQIGSFSRRSKQIALVAGPLLATLVYFLLPDS